MIHCVERLDAQLEVEELVRTEIVVLEQRQAGIGYAWVANVGQAAAGVAEGERRWLIKPGDDLIPIVSRQNE
jgi:hypothetical protein